MAKRVTLSTISEDYVTVPVMKVSDSVTTALQSGDEKKATAAPKQQPGLPKRLPLREALSGQSVGKCISGGPVAIRGRKGMSDGRFGTFRSAVGFNVVVNSVAAKYIQFMGTNPTLGWNGIINNMAELADFDAIYDEIFVHWVELRFQPVNKNSSNATASGNATGSPGFVNTLGATVVFLPNNSAAYSDASTAWSAMAAAAQHKLVNMADSWTFKGKNTSKFSWDGPLGDQTSTNATMEWTNIATINNQLGGRFQLATPEPSGAAAGIGTLVEGGLFGHVLCVAEFSMRARA